MKLYKKYILLFTLFVSAIMFAQQEPNVAFYRYSMEAFNPAYAGSLQMPSFVVNLRSQWQGVDEAPETQMLLASAPFGNKVGLGLSVINDKTFVEKQTKAFINFSYKLAVSDYDDLYLGINVGGNFYSVNAEGLKTYNYTADPFLQNNSKFNPNMGIGALLKGDTYFVSLSTPGLLNTKRFKEDQGMVIEATDKPHVYFAAGYDHIIDREWKLKPSVMARYVGGIPLAVDFTAAASYKDRFELGVTYRTENAFAGLALFGVSDWFSVGYAYDNSIKRDLDNIGTSTHEFLLLFKLIN